MNINDCIPIVLVGSLDSFDLIIRACQQRRPGMAYRVLGVVDLAEGNIGREILNVPILGTIDCLREILFELERQGRKPRRILLTTPIGGQPLRELQQISEQAKASLCQIPKITEFRALTSSSCPLELCPIAFENVLARPQVKLGDGATDGLINGRRVVVTGAGGSIGSELCRQIARRQPSELILLDFSEYSLYAIDMEMRTKFPEVSRVAALVDIRDANSLDCIFRKHRPELVFHAAALKHVPLVESNPIQGVLTNVFGTRNVAEAARHNGAVAFIQISTDKAVEPTNVMGATKRFAEFYIQALDVAASSQESVNFTTLFKTVRFGNVIGSSGSVVPLFQQQIDQGGPVTVTHSDVTRYFMTIGEASELVLHALAEGMQSQRHSGEIFVLDMGSPVRIYDIAKQMIRLSEREDVRIEIIGLRSGEKLYEDLFEL